jgi:hypothetical protein
MGFFAAADNKDLDAGISTAVWSDKTCFKSELVEVAKHTGGDWD